MNQVTFKSARNVFFLGLALSLFSCGRKATSADCQLIVDRVLDVEANRLSDGNSETVVKKKDELRLKLKDELKQCVGRRITESMLECVKKAKTSDEVSSCIR